MHNPGWLWMVLLIVAGVGLTTPMAHATEPRLVPLEESEQAGVAEQRWYQLRTIVELGGNLPLYHKIQFSNDGTYFDYVEEGGQDVVFPFVRLSAEAKFAGRHSVILLLQPLEFRTRALLQRDVVVDGLTFPEDTAVDLLYSFPFYRVSYMFDFVGSPRTEIAAGLSFQLRNATIAFSSVDGELYRVNRDLGPVPILKFRAQHAFENGTWLGFEADGFYAPGAILNLRDVDVLGAIVDASLRAGLVASERHDVFVNLRYFGGGSDGQSEEEPGQPGDGYTRNWLHFFIVSLGVTYNL